MFWTAVGYFPSFPAGIWPAGHQCGCDCRLPEVVRDIPKQTATDSWKAGGVKDLLPDTAQLFLHQPFPSFCKPITGEGQKCSDVKTEGSALEVAAGCALSFSPCLFPVGFGGREAACCGGMLSSPGLHSHQITLLCLPS